MWLSYSMVMIGPMDLEKEKEDWVHQNMNIMDNLKMISVKDRVLALIWIKIIIKENGEMERNVIIIVIMNELEIIFRILIKVNGFQYFYEQN